MIRSDEFLLDGTNVVMVWQAATNANGSLDELCAWLAERSGQIDGLVYRHGGILLRGFSCLQRATDFQRVLDVLAPKLMEYVGGSAPRRVVSGRIMTTTELPGRYSVPLHQEMAYTDNSPDRLAFFCEVAAPVGGETTVGDMRRVTRRIDPAVLHRFEAHKGIQIRRNLPPPGTVASRPGIPRAWTEVFGTTDPAAAERTVARSGWRAEWLPNGSMQLWQEIRPAMRAHPRTGDRVWYNQVHRFSPIGMLKRLRHDGMEDEARSLEKLLAEAPHLLDRAFHGDGTPIADEDVVHVFDILTEEAVPLRWQRGDLLIIDNILVSHGRRAYSGDRLVLTALIQTDGAEHGRAPRERATFAGT